ncbi:hypothetical protein AAFF_G00157870 [Aldrovandia affinis]|uniref:Uncharacterized protein n=1 Tax=Aldrovandia affinis TaxID=143900 RepID=A0AAD7RQT0_9TELE|nr:hypothetical protein AAFF_G00157870 [Aldrovandia affinis]
MPVIFVILPGVRRQRPPPPELISTTHFLIVFIGRRHQNCRAAPAQEGEGMEGQQSPRPRSRLLHLITSGDRPPRPLRAAPASARASGWQGGRAFAPRSSSRNPGPQGPLRHHLTPSGRTALSLSHEYRNFSHCAQLYFFSTLAFNLQT